MGIVQLRILALPLLAILFGAGLTWAAAAPKKKAVARPSATKSSARPAARNSAARRTVTKGRATSSYARNRRGRSPQPVAARRYHGQQAPTQERYTEIQQAEAFRFIHLSEFSAHSVTLPIDKIVAALLRERFSGSTPSL